jgi:hypothetical protein
MPKKERVTKTREMIKEIGMSIINFFVKRKKLFVRILLIILGLIVIFVLFLLATGVHLTLNDELSIKLTPLDISLKSTERVPVPIDFSVETPNFYFCKTQCSYVFRKMSDNYTIDKSSFIIGSDEKMNKSYILYPENKGEGQIIYSFEIRCNNLKTALCRTEEEQMYKSSFITLNYGLSSDETSGKIEANHTIFSTMEEVRKADSLIRSNSAYIESLIAEISQNKSAVKIPDDFSNLLLENNNLSMLLKKEMDSIDGFKTVWAGENYTELMNMLDSYDNESARKIYDSASRIKSEAEKTARVHDDIVSLLNSLSTNGEIINKAQLFYMRLDDKKNAAMAEEIASGLNIINLKLKSNGISSYTNLYNELLSINSSISEIGNAYNQDRTKLFMEIQYDVLIAEHMLEKIEVYSNADGSETNGTGTNNSTNSTTSSISSSDSNNGQDKISGIYRTLMIEYPKIYTNASILTLLRINDTTDVFEINCIAESTAENYIHESNLDAVEFRAEHYPNYTSDKKLSRIISVFSENLKSEAENDLINEFKNNQLNSTGSKSIKDQKSLAGSSIYYDALNEIVPEKKKRIYAIDYPNESYSNISSADYAGMALVNLTFRSPYCEDDSINITKKTLVLQESEEPLISGKRYNEISSNYVPSLSVNYPKCCFNNECRNCCSEDNCDSNASNYPIIFVHGHAFSKKNTPDYSLGAFGKIQLKLAEDGFVNGGQITTGSDLNKIPNREWGTSNFPVTFRASYYYISYYDLGAYNLVSEKNEGIENYAIRLKEIIDNIKEKTGKEKVIIVAHSMGGLVAREYIALFGEDNVDKLIMIGTPNNGVDGRVKSLCSVFGSKKECTDLSAGSVFLKRLNSTQNIPIKVKFYTIYGTGCDMDGRDGDGIALAESAKLSYSENHEIKGQCTDTLKTNLHNNLLNPEVYPETYDILVSVLKQ